METKDCPNCFVKFIPDIDEQGSVMTGPYQMCPICEKETGELAAEYWNNIMDESLNKMDLEND